MKKLLIGISVIVVVIAAIVAVRFAYCNLRGARPAFGPAAHMSSPISAVNATGLPLHLPDGFSISIFAKDLVGPRVLLLDPNGTLLASIPGTGKVVALPDKNGDGIADEIVTVAGGLKGPHGIDFSPSTKQLYIAEENQIAAYDYDPQTYQTTHKRAIVDLPAGGNHTTRTIRFGPDGKLYIAVGSSCNVCNEKDTRRAAISVANADGSDFKNFASGLRNAVFFVWSPIDGQMWATEMGRDLLGDNLPPDEINIIKRDKWYGWPSCYGKQIADRDFIKNYNIYHISPESVCTSLSEPSTIDVQAHSAPLGLAFTPTSWPKDYQNNLLVSFHGSWNRTVPTGYKVVRYKLDAQGKYLGVEDFLTGFLSGSAALGRPVDLLFDANGTLFVSDDKAGVIYQITQKK